MSPFPYGRSRKAGLRLAGYELTSAPGFGGTWQRWKDVGMEPECWAELVKAFEEEEEEE